jgi:ABC-type phosphate/phosphonate transport system permease subunit
MSQNQAVLEILQKDDESTKRKSSKVTNIWFLRTLILVFGLIIAGALLAYSIIFVDTYVAFGNTTSYFPWAWATAYSDANAVQSLFLESFTISVIAIAACAVSLYFIIPELRKSLVVSRK